MHVVDKRRNKVLSIFIISTKTDNKELNARFRLRLGRWRGKVATVLLRVIYIFKQKISRVSNIGNINNDVAIDCLDI